MSPLLSGLRQHLLLEVPREVGPLRRQEHHLLLLVPRQVRLQGLSEGPPFQAASSQVSVIKNQDKNLKNKVQLDYGTGKYKKVSDLIKTFLFLLTILYLKGATAIFSHVLKFCIIFLLFSLFHSSSLKKTFKNVPQIFFDSTTLVVSKI